MASKPPFVRTREGCHSKARGCFGMSVTFSRPPFMLTEALSSCDAAVSLDFQNAPVPRPQCASRPRPLQFYDTCHTDRKESPLRHLPRLCLTVSTSLSLRNVSSRLLHVSLCGLLTAGSGNPFEPRLSAASGLSSGSPLSLGPRGIRSKAPFISLQGLFFPDVSLCVPSLARMNGPAD